MRRVIIVQPYGIGDTLFITPVLRALRLIPSVETVDLLIGSRTKDIIVNNPHINEIFVIDKDKMRDKKPFERFKYILALGKILRKKKYDLLLDYSMRGEHAFWGKYFLGIPKRAGYDYKDRGFFHNIKLSIPEGFQGKHVVEFVCELAELAKIPVDDRFLEFYFGGGEEEKIRKKLEGELEKNSDGFIVVAPGGGASWGKDAHLKQWSVENFSELIKYLKKKIKFERVCIVGSLKEKQIANKLKELVNIKVNSFAGNLSIAETCWLLKNAKLFLGNDGGLLHLAKAVGTRVIAIYGPVNPREYGPYPLKETDNVIYKNSHSSKGYYKFRYEKDDTSIKDLTIEDATEILGGNICRTQM